jgi:hypothetical protein
MSLRSLLFPSGWKIDIECQADGEPLLEKGGCTCKADSGQTYDLNAVLGR